MTTLEQLNALDLRAVGRKAGCSCSIAINGDPAGDSVRVTHDWTTSEDFAVHDDGGWIDPIIDWLRGLHETPR